MRIKPRPEITQEELIAELRAMSYRELMSVPLTGRYSGMFKTFCDMDRVARGEELEAPCLYAIGGNVAGLFAKTYSACSKAASDVVSIRIGAISSQGDDDSTPGPIKENIIQANPHSSLNIKITVSGESQWRTETLVRLPQLKAA